MRKQQEPFNQNDAWRRPGSFPPQPTGSRPLRFRFVRFLPFAFCPLIAFPMHKLPFFLRCVFIFPSFPICFFFLPFLCFIFALLASCRILFLFLYISICAVLYLCTRFISILFMLIRQFPISFTPFHQSFLCVLFALLFYLPPFLFL